MRKVKPYLLVSLLITATAEGCSTGHVISFNDHGTGGTGHTVSSAPVQPNLNIGQNAREAGLIPWDPHAPSPFPTPFPTPTPPPTTPTPFPIPRPAPKR